MNGTPTSRTSLPSMPLSSGPMWTRTVGIATTVFFTGAAALIEQVLWGRMLYRLLGGTALSVATVLAGFLGGIALGGFVAGRWIRGGLRGVDLGGSRRSPLHIYGAVELASGGSALLFSTLLGSSEDLAATSVGPAVLLLLLVVFTLPLGAGFPILVLVLEGWIRGSGKEDSNTEVSRSISLFYGINALGGCAGALVAGFLLIPYLGEVYTIGLAVLLQGGCGVALIALARRWHVEGVRASPSLMSSPQPSSAPVGLLFLLLFMSGLVALYWEVVWTRILVLGVGSSVYAFSVVTAAVLAGIGVGSVTFQGSSPRRCGFWLLPLCLTWILVPTFFAVSHLPDAYLFGVRTMGLTAFSWGALGAGLVVLVPSFLVGTLFPWVVARAPSRCGSLVAVNAVGAACGAYLGGPLGAALIDPELAFEIGVLLAAALTCCGVLVTERLSSWGRATVGTLAVAAFFSVFLPGGPADSSDTRRPGVWDFGRLTLGVFQWRYEDLLDESHTVEDQVAKRELVVVEHGREVVVTVGRDVDANALWVRGNGKAEGSVPIKRVGVSKAELPTQILLSVYPALLRPNAPTAIIGLGSGVTLGAAFILGAGSIDVFEIEPAFLRAIRNPKVRPQFDEYLGGALESPNVRVSIGDARRLLLGEFRERRWSVMISQPSEPWISGSSGLFTKEFFELAAERLDADGIFAQWLQLYSLDQQSLRLAVRTFRSVFERVFVVRPPASGALLLIGSRQPFELSRLLTPISDERRRIVSEAGAVDASDLVALIILGPDGVDDWVESDHGERNVLNSDQRNILEFRGPLYAHGGVTLARQNVKEIRQLGGRDPVTRYLPAVARDPQMRMHLARRNGVFGDFWEALALIEDDTTADAQRLREVISREIESYLNESQPEAEAPGR